MVRPVRKYGATMTKGKRRYLVALVEFVVRRGRMLRISDHMRCCDICRTYKQAREHLGLEWV